MDIANIKLGYAAYSKDLNVPGDKRRFVRYAKLRRIEYEVADPEKKYDLIYVTHGADLSIWHQYPRNGALIIYEIIDSYMFEREYSLKALFRGVVKYIIRDHKYLIFNYKKTIDQMCIRADAVVCSTQEQKDYILNFCKNTHIILDYKSIFNRIKVDYDIGREVNLVWEGLPYNIGMFSVINEALSVLSKKYIINLHVITTLKYGGYMGRFIKKDSLVEINKVIDINNIYLYEWNDMMCSHIASACDIAIIPIDVNNKMDWNKPENKLLIFWKMGLPVIVSDTAAHLRAMNNAGISMACKSVEDWVDMIEHYINNASDRALAANKGYHYSISVSNDELISSKWDNLFMSVAP